MYSFRTTSYTNVIPVDVHNHQTSFQSIIVPPNVDPTKHPSHQTSIPLNVDPTNRRSHQSSLSPNVDPTSCRDPLYTNPAPGREVGRVYYRGCLDRTFATAGAETVALMHVPFVAEPSQGDACRSLPRRTLFGQRHLPADNITLCSCACDRCNVYPEPVPTAAAAASIVSTRPSSSFFAATKLLPVYLAIVFFVLGA